jgi:hypothetical protein
MNTASLCSLAGRYDNPIPPRFLALIDCLKIPALVPSLRKSILSQVCLPQSLSITYVPYRVPVLTYVAQVRQSKLSVKISLKIKSRIKTNGTVHL